MGAEVIDSKSQRVSMDFDAMFRMYYAPMILYAMRFLKEKEASEDMVQEVFVQLLSKKNTITVKRSMHSFLIMVLHNRIIDTLRKQKNQRTEQLNENLIEETIEETAFTVDLYARLLEEIDKLPAKNAQVMRLKLEGKNDKEIAELLGIRYETVRSHVKHGISSLREKFDLMLLLTIFG